MCGGERVYLAQPLNHGFKSGECPNLSDGKHLSVGIRKSALVVEGPKGRGSCNAAVTVDCKHDSVLYLFYLYRK